jgi:uncharacterized protein YeaO (DUF488 family)
MGRAWQRSVLYTAHSTYGGRDRLDVSGEGDHLGSRLSPPEHLRAPLVEAKLRGVVPPDVWDAFERGYRRHLITLLVRSPDDLRAALAPSELTLVCTCAQPDHCHRSVLARLLTKLGAPFGGERPVPYRTVFRSGEFLRPNAAAEDTERASLYPEDYEFPYAPARNRR